MSNIIHLTRRPKRQLSRFEAYVEAREAAESRLLDAIDRFLSLSPFADSSPRCTPDDLPAHLRDSITELVTSLGLAR